ncbi:MAG: hypothetical protein IPP48_07575 [Chitinophagaceae bacterium]|nr:hypothetical protein [Chitinophagaceae bacterium]
MNSKAKKTAPKKATAKKVAPKKKAAPKKVIVKKTPTKKTNSPALPNHIISKEKGYEMVARFAENQKDLNKIYFFKGIEFSRSLFENILQLPGCTKVRIYNAVNDRGEQTFVITGADSKMNDIYFKNIKPVTKTKSVAKSITGADTGDGVGKYG